MDSQPLPHGWVQKVDHETNRPYYVDTKAMPPRSIWVHPYNDQQYLWEHPEVQEELVRLRAVEQRNVEQVTVEQMTADPRRLDITPYIRRNPKFPYSIGDGGCGSVYRGTYCMYAGTNQEINIDVVIKLLMGTDGERDKVEQRLNREITCWRNLKHPNVVELLGLASLDRTRPPGLVSRYLQRSDIMAYIGRHPEFKRRIAQEVAAGVEYLHAEGVVHGDLKVDNVLISDEGVAQINDFGIACIVDAKGFTTSLFKGSLRCMAPELMPIWNTNEPTRPTKMSDIYSFGILLLQLFHGYDQDKRRRRPYNHISTDGAVPKAVHNGERPIRERYNWINDQHWTLIQQCWAGEPSERPVIAVALRAL